MKRETTTPTKRRAQNVAEIARAYNDSALAKDHNGALRFTALEKNGKNSIGVMIDGDKEQARAAALWIFNRFYNVYQISTKDGEIVCYRTIY